jgi:hypothetical protein
MGAGWPAYGNLVLGLALPGSGTTTWLHGTFPVNGAGNFAATVYVGPEYAGQSGVRVVAYDAVSLIRVETLYGVVNTPVARLVVGPAAVVPGQVAGITGTGWPAGVQVQLLAPVPDGKAGEDVVLGRVTTSANGTWTLQVRAPGLVTGGKYDFVIRTQDQVFSVVFDY